MFNIVLYLFFVFISFLLFYYSIIEKNINILIFGLIFFLSTQWIANTVFSINKLKKDFQIILNSKYVSMTKDEIIKELSEYKIRYKFYKNPSSEVEVAEYLSSWNRLKLVELANLKISKNNSVKKHKKINKKIKQKQEAEQKHKQEVEQKYKQEVEQKYKQEVEQKHKQEVEKQFKQEVEKQFKQEVKKQQNFLYKIKNRHINHEPTPTPTPTPPSDNIISNINPDIDTDIIQDIKQDIKFQSQMNNYPGIDQSSNSGYNNDLSNTKKNKDDDKWF
ncbi:MAG: cell envelope integrity protein TolA [Mycoplasmataceae bacterium]|nr:cell envelope integrity protein TolA [Mycoplasmataceae bacterium]